MILKLYQVNSGGNAFFDGFDYVNTTTVNREQLEREKYSCSVSCYTSPDDLKILRLELCDRSNNLVRVVYAGACYNVYLMSNEGKTIERIN
jgi:hypothetical protein